MQLGHNNNNVCSVHLEYAPLNIYAINEIVQYFNKQFKYLAIHNPVRGSIPEVLFIHVYLALNSKS